MSVPKINTNTNGERSEYLEGGTVRSISPGINLQLQLSCKDSSVNTNLPDAFQPKPKISRTPPNSNETNLTTTSSKNLTSSSNVVITIDNDDITDESKYDYDDPGYVHDSGTYQSQASKNLNSPSLSIEYPPGSSIPIVKKRKKFQFKKDHYQRFIGTSSAKKTKELRKNMMRDRSRSNSLISYPSSAAIMDHELVKAHIHLNDNNNNMTKAGQESLPPSPPSDDIISTLSQMMNKTPNKLPHHIVTNSAHIAVLPKRRKSNKSMDSDEITVSSSPSLLETTNTTKTTTKSNVSLNGYSSPYQYRSRQQWTTLIHSQVQKRQEIEKQNACSKTNAVKTPLASARSNYRPKKSMKTPTFGGASKSDGDIDPDKIRIALNNYDQQKGQNLEEIFKPQKQCFYCVIL